MRRFHSRSFKEKYMKLIKEMEAIGQPPTEAKRYEMLREMSRTLISSLLFFS